MIFEEFYKTTDARKRLSVLNEIEKEHIDECKQEFELVKKVFLTRYSFKSIRKPPVDIFMLAFLRLIELFNRKPSIRVYKEEFLSQLFNLGINDTIQNIEMDFDLFSKEDFDAASESYDVKYAYYLYLELKNTTACYIATSKSEKYHKKFMGLISTGDEKRARDVILDCRNLSVTNSKNTFLEKEAALLVDAVQDELKIEFPDGRTL